MATLVKYVYKCPVHQKNVDVLMERKDAGKPTPCCVAGCGGYMKQVYTTYSLVVK